MENEKRLIAYDAVYSYAFEGVHGGGLENEDIDAIINAIDAVPTIDAVEVVRCKDCEFCVYNSSNDTYKCRSMNGMYRTVKPDDFCSYGERRAGDGH